MFVSSRWGGSDWGLQRAIRASPPGAVSGTRYRKLTITQTWTKDRAGNPVPEGKRIDVIDYGDGLNEPTLTNLRADANPHDLSNVDAYPYNLGQGAATSESAIHMEFKTALDYIVRSELSEPEPGFADTLLTESYAEFAQMTNFQYRFLREQFGNPLFLDRAYWSKGPMTWRTVPDPDNPGLMMVSSPPTYFADMHTLNPALTYVGLGRGGDFFIRERPPFDGAVARLNTIWVSVPHITRSPFKAGSVPLSKSTWMEPLSWFVVLTKVALGQSTRNKVGIQGAGHATALQGVTQFFCQANAPIVGGILQPPPKETIVDFRDRAYVCRTSPDWSPLGIAPSCFTAT